MVSKRPTRKHANEHANGNLPGQGEPGGQADHVRFGDADVEGARPGNFLAKPPVIVDFERSASRVTMRSVPRSEIDERLTEGGARGFGG